MEWDFINYLTNYLKPQADCQYKLKFLLTWDVLFLSLALTYS